MSAFEEYLKQYKPELGFKLLSFLPASPWTEELARQEEWQVRCEVTARDIPSLEALLAKLRECWPDQHERIYYQLSSGIDPYPPAPKEG